MELECMKYKERMSSEDAECRHPGDYCKYRTSCVIQFMFATGEKNGNQPGGIVEETEGDTTTMELRFDKDPNGLLPAIVQDHLSGEILMLAYVNQEAWDKTVETGKAYYWSRSRRKIWLKGESSGHVQLVKEIRVDCDLDTVLFKVEQLGGAACHKGYKSCFFQRVSGNRLVVSEEKVFDPEKVYGNR